MFQSPLEYKKLGCDIQICTRFHCHSAAYSCPGIFLVLSIHSGFRNWFPTSWEQKVHCVIKTFEMSPRKNPGADLSVPIFTVNPNYGSLLLDRWRVRGVGLW